MVASIFDGLGSEFEAVSELALRVPARVICGVLGIADDDWLRLESWTPDFLRIFLPDACTAAERVRMERASANFLEYFDDLIERRRREPRDDLTSALAELESDGSLSRDELIGALRGLLTAGFETSAATISAALLSFAAQPEQLALLRRRPDVLPAAVEELLRWETPVRTQTRYLGVDTSFHGTRLPAGTPMWLLLGSANHDRLQFPLPARVDFDRSAIEHVAFGGGRHFCLGAYLARVELQSVFAQIARRWQRVHVDTERLQRRANLQFPSLQVLSCSVA